MTPVVLVVFEAPVTLVEPEALAALVFACACLCQRGALGLYAVAVALMKACRTTAVVLPV